MAKVIIHVSEIDISLASGMGKVEYYWQNTFEEAGYTFIHIGPREVGRVLHSMLFSYKAYKYFKKLNIHAVAFIVHEPVSRFFVNRNIPCFIESHGIERRSWEGMLNGSIPAPEQYPITLFRKLWFPIWRLSGCDKGLQKGTKLLLINNEDRAYAKLKYKRNDDDIYVFRNGATANRTKPYEDGPRVFTILFNGSWSARKGVSTLIAAADILHKKSVEVQYLLVGTGQDEKTIQSKWPAHLRSHTRIIPFFQPHNEFEYLNASSLFVLPSYFEGQPLSLLQAMAAGKCCITTNCCGQKDLIEDQVSGFLFEPGDVNELARLIEYCYNNRQVVSRIGENAKRSTEERTWESVSGEVANYISRELNLAS